MINREPLLFNRINEQVRKYPYYVLSYSTIDMNSRETLLFNRINEQGRI